MNNFKINSKVLNKALANLKPVISKNPTLPILENILIQVSPGQIKLTATDLQNSLCITLEAEGENAFNLLLPFYAVNEFLKTIKNEIVSFTYNSDSQKLSINNFTVLCDMDANGFPKTKEVTGTSYPLSINDLNLIRENNFPFASNDDLRPAMTGICFKFNESELIETASTDGHRLSISYFKKNEKTVSQVIVPKNVIKFSKGLESVNEIIIGATYGVIKSDKLVLTFRLIDEKYPAYENVLPDHSDNIISVSSENLQIAIKRVLPAANKTTHQVRFMPSLGTLKLHTEDLDFSNEANEEVNCKFEGDLSQIGFNGKFMLEILSKLKGDIEVKMNEANRPATIEKDNQYFLLMPVMLSNYA